MGNMAAIGASLYGVASDWDPFNISHLAAWLDADNISVGDNQPVSLWADKTQNGNDFSQPVETAKPIFYADAGNGAPGLSFDGIDDYMSTGGSPIPLGGDTGSYVVVVEPVAQPINNQHYVLGRFSQADGVYTYWLNAGAYNTRISVNGIRDTVSRSRDFHEPMVLTGLYDGATIKQEANNAGLSVGTAQAGNWINDDKEWQIGANAATPEAKFWKGFIYSVLLFKEVLTAEERLKLWTYFSKKYSAVSWV